jgi:hypothetical protein
MALRLTDSPTIVSGVIFMQRTFAQAVALLKRKEKRRETLEGKLYDLRTGTASGNKKSKRSAKSVQSSGHDGGEAGAVSG